MAKAVTLDPYLGKFTCTKLLWDKNAERLRECGKPVMDAQCAQFEDMHYGNATCPEHTCGCWETDDLTDYCLSCDNCCCKKCARGCKCDPWP